MEHLFPPSDACPAENRTGYNHRAECMVDLCFFLRFQKEITSGKPRFYCPMLLIAWSCQAAAAIEGVPAKSGGWKMLVLFGAKVGFVFLVFLF